ncbi:MAG: RNase P subunit p30 family protein [Candidatus Nanoarchaeia archaeon]
MIDIVFPKQNESEFIKKAEFLGFDALCFVYGLKSAKEKRQQLQKLQNETKIKLFLGILAEQKEIQKAKAFADLVLVRTPQNTQHTIEKEKPDIIFDLELNQQPDSMHFRASGLNHVLCKAAANNQVIIAISLNTILSAQNKQQNQQKIIGRITQNIMLCRKYKAQIAFASFAEHPMQMRAISELVAFAFVLGMNPTQAKQSLNIIQARAELNQKKKSWEWLAEGFEIIG